MNQLNAARMSAACEALAEQHIDYIDSRTLSPKTTLDFFHVKRIIQLDKLEFFEPQPIFFQKGIDSHAPS